jgi:hypothetical protein
MIAAVSSSGARLLASFAASAPDSAAAVPWAVLVALFAAVVAVTAAGGSCVAAAVAAGVARARARRGAKRPASPPPPMAVINGGGGAHHHSVYKGSGSSADAWRAWLLGMAGLPPRGTPLIGVRAGSAQPGGSPFSSSFPPAAAPSVQSAGAFRPAGGLASHPLVFDASDGECDEDSESQAQPLGGPAAAPSATVLDETAQERAAAAAAAAAPQSLAGRARARVAPAFGRAVKAADNALALLCSLPRTLRTLGWAVQSGVSYKRYLMTADPLMDPEGYHKGLSELHDYWAAVSLGCFGSVLGGGGSSGGCVPASPAAAGCGGPGRLYAAAAPLYSP